MNNTATQIDKNRNSEKLFDLLKTGSEEFLPEILQIIEEGFESDFKKNDWNLLHLAVQDGGNPDVVDKLISAGVDPTEKTDEGLDALEMAIGNPLVRLMTNTSPNKEVIKILSKEKEGKK